MYIGIFFKNIAFGRAWKALVYMYTGKPGFLGLVPLVYHHVLRVIVVVITRLEGLFICFWIKIHLLSHYIEDESHQLTFSCIVPCSFIFQYNVKK